jgi:formylmethanofuran dehydrogenase subunit B
VTEALRIDVPFCGLPCSAVVLPRDGREPGGGCPVCRDAVAAALDDDAGDTPRIEGRPATLDEAVARAAAALKEARRPFVHGLAWSSVGTARRAAGLAWLARGAIDVEGAGAVEPDRLALSTFGLASATFGALRDRADVVLLWRTDPRSTHPNLLPPWRDSSGSGLRREFLLVPVPGSRVPAPVPADTLIVEVPEGGDLAALLRLRMLATGRAEASSGTEIDRAAALLRGARYAALIWDPTATAGPSGEVIAAALALLARDLNRSGRAAARPLGSGGNLPGATGAIASVTGFPRAVGFFSGEPRMEPESFGAPAMLAGGADRLLLIGARSAGSLEAAGRIPSIVIGPRLLPGGPEPEIVIPSARAGLSAGGLWLRADGLPVPLRAVLPTTRPTEDEVLDRLAAAAG